MKKKLLLTTAPLLSLILLSACEVGPDYERPAFPAPDAFKEVGIWNTAVPQDAIDRGDWWSIYNDATLNSLENQIDISNQNLKQAEANYRASVAIVAQTRSSLFPLIGGNASATRSGNGGRTTTTNGTTITTGKTAATSYDLSADGSWTLDIWGKIRRQLESDEANAEASAATLANARLSAQATLATDYFALRIQDALIRTLNRTVEDDQKILTILQNQYKVGVAAQSDVLAAQTQLESAQAAASGAALTRAQLEHAIAVLVGRNPSDFSLIPVEDKMEVPIVPATVPSEILQRRPDIATAERQMAAANAEIGVAEAAYFPQITLSASYGFGASQLNKLANAASTIWSFGAAASDNLIDWGARDAATEEARANYDGSVAFYRQTVLTAFQNVEDNLAAQRILVDQQKQQDQATADARKAEQIALNQYREGIVPYNNVLTAQIVTLGDEQASLNVLNNRLAASVALVEAIGGGWKSDKLPDVTGPIIPNPL